MLLPASTTWRMAVLLKPCLALGLALGGGWTVAAAPPAAPVPAGRASAVQIARVELLSGERAGYVRPAWSPDGQWLGLGRAGMAGIELTRRDGKEWKLLTLETDSGYRFDWSPDSAQIAYRTRRTESNLTWYVIKSVDLASGKTAELSKPAGEVSPPVWLSSNGNQCVSFLLGTNLVNTPWQRAKRKLGTGAFQPAPLLFTDRGQVWRAGPDSGARTALTTDGGMEPVWSPDRSQVVYSQMGVLMIMAPDGSKKRELTRGHHPSWSPDGTMLVYDVSRDDGHQILSSDLYVINVDGTEPTRLTHTPEVLECEPAWSPDGRCIACRTEDAGRVLLLWLQ